MGRFHDVVEINAQVLLRAPEIAQLSKLLCKDLNLTSVNLAVFVCLT